MQSLFSVGPKLVAAAAVYLSAMMLLAWIEPRQEAGVFPTDPPTPYLHYLPENEPRGRILVVHGIAANKDTMKLISAALADGGLEVYAIDLPGHGDSPSGFDAFSAQRAIRQTLDRLGMNTVVLGHSMGAGLLLDLAATEPFSTMVLLSPPPTPLAQIHADRVLAVRGRFDIPRISSFVPALADIGAPHVESRILPWGGHSAAIFNPAAVDMVVEWLVGEAGASWTALREVLIASMLISGVAFGILLLPRRQIETSEPSGRLSTTLVRYVAACAAAILILEAVEPLAWLRLFGADYLIGFVLLAGAVLWLQMPRVPRLQAAPLWKALLAAAFVIAVLGYGAASTVLPFDLNGGRWWRFPFIAMASFPLFAFDELHLRRFGRVWKTITAALVTRVILWALLVTGILFLNRQDAFLVIISHLIVLFWIMLWFAAGVVRRNTQDPIAAAFFSALVQGWAFAALSIKA